jgi:predicted MFS family arabinose efflux permease
VVALIATASSYALSAYAIYTNSYLLFIASRFISGLSGGAFEIAQAAVIDISTVKNKARNLGYITMAASLGFVAGPVITSAMSSLHISHTIPFLFAGVMALVNITFIMMFMRKDLPKNPGLIVDFRSVYRAILFLVADKRVRVIGIIYLLVQCGWGFYAQGVALFLHTVYGYGITETGLFYAAMGFATAFASLTIQPRIFARVSTTKALVVSALICGFGLVVVNIVGHEFMQWILSIVLSASQLICYTALLYIISMSVSDKEQGKAMGAAGAGFGLAWFVNDIAMGHLSSITPGTPITVGGLFYFVAVAIFIIAVKIFRERVQ